MYGLDGMLTMAAGGWYVWVVYSLEEQTAKNTTLEKLVVSLTMGCESVDERVLRSLVRHEDEYFIRPTCQIRNQRYRFGTCLCVLLYMGCVRRLTVVSPPLHNTRYMLLSCIE